MNKLKFVVKNFEEILAGMFLSTTVIIVIVNVILRKFFNHGIYWAEEVSTTCFVWSVFVGASATVKHRMNIGIDLLITKGSEKTKAIIKLVIDILLVIITSYVFYLSIIFTKISVIKPMPVLGVSSAYINSALIAGFGLMSIHVIKFIIQDIMELKKMFAESEGGY